MIEVKNTVRAGSTTLSVESDFLLWVLLSGQIVKGLRWFPPALWEVTFNDFLHPEVYFLMSFTLEKYTSPMETTLLVTITGCDEIHCASGEGSLHLWVHLNDAWQTKLLRQQVTSDACPLGRQVLSLSSWYTAMAGQMQSFQMPGCVGEGDLSEDVQESAWRMRGS
jgi:hypothetical protein